MRIFSFSQTGFVNQGDKIYSGIYERLLLSMFLLSILHLIVYYKVTVYSFWKICDWIFMSRCKTWIENEKKFLAGLESKYLILNRRLLTTYDLSSMKLTAIQVKRWISLYEIVEINAALGIHSLEI